MHDPLGCRDDPFERLSGDSRRHGKKTAALPVDTIGSLAYSHAQWPALS
jgi:hypothetical protein